MKIYVQMRSPEGLETIDEFESMSEAKKMLKEYRMADKFNCYYLSSRPCKAWGNR